MFVRYVKHSIVGLNPTELPLDDVTISSSNLSNVAFSISVSVNDTPVVVIREPDKYHNIKHNNIAFTSTTNGLRCRAITGSSEFAIGKCHALYDEC